MRHQITLFLTPGAAVALSAVPPWVRRDALLWHFGIIPNGVRLTIKGIGDPAPDSQSRMVSDAIEAHADLFRRLGTI